MAYSFEVCFFLFLSQVKVIFPANSIVLQRQNGGELKMEKKKDRIKIKPDKTHQIKMQTK